MAIRWYSLVIDSADPHALATWWAKALGWTMTTDEPDEVWLEPPVQLDGPVRIPELCFVPVPEGKTVKNRLHLDLAPESDDDHAAMVQRLLDLGATRAEVGQRRGEVTWEVFTDPEGNELCLLSARE
ncbi:VOC family protein [Arsenicicoccus piscis]|uniref:Glyoxalase-like domain-containing protein n=1 Tax=Arsenicicoccus piscis TaxID=673954 RepID=A0ABQ6HKV9_9MICO|nr:VOC family protein [Arsenicicoccus piscis]MCH8627716.1 VOC family protein [Arsenicicoccus piscis]GMA18225.1 hypothetical protein GCM10025862_02460 [Arsenicicoccus piscis]